jgi:hypothetical protein
LLQADFHSSAVVAKFVAKHKDCKLFCKNFTILRIHLKSLIELGIFQPFSVLCAVQTSRLHCGKPFLATRIAPAMGLVAHPVNPAVCLRD